MHENNGKETSMTGSKQFSSVDHARSNRTTNAYSSRQTIVSTNHAGTISGGQGVATNLQKNLKRSPKPFPTNGISLKELTSVISQRSATTLEGSKLNQPQPDRWALSLTHS